MLQSAAVNQACVFLLVYLLALRVQTLFSLCTGCTPIHTCLSLTHTMTVVAYFAAPLSTHTHLAQGARFFADAVPASPRSRLYMHQHQHVNLCVYARHVLRSGTLGPALDLYLHNGGPPL